eukprot:m.17848 g.17848  ORF g.17848 m.17848 type:complete len:377 (-) comp6125_c1_seq1:92-1222(-)
MMAVPPPYEKESLLSHIDTTNNEKPPSYEGTGKYSSVAKAKNYTYLIRSDGVVERTLHGNKFSQITPPEGQKYVSVATSCTESLVFLLTDQGLIIQVRGDANKVKLPDDEIRPPAGLRYVAMSVGPTSSYFIRSDGAAERFIWGRLSSVLQPSPGLRYELAGAGYMYSYLLQSDGCIAKVEEKGHYLPISRTQVAVPADKLNITIIKPTTLNETSAKATKQQEALRLDTSVRYINIIADQITSATKKEYYKLGRHVYFVRSDGIVERRHGRNDSAPQFIVPEQGCKYLTMSSAGRNSYFIRDDGACCITNISGDKIEHVIKPEERSIRYTQAAAGGHIAFLCRSDGEVVCNKGNKTLVASSKEPIVGTNMFLLEAK